MSRTQRRNATKRPAKPPIRNWLMYGTGVLLLAIAVVAIGLSNQSLRTASEAPTIAKIHKGESAPEFIVTTSQGALDLRTAKKPILLEVFATWCPHCQRETTVLNSLYRRYGQRVDFVAVSGSNTAADRQSSESQEDVNAFAAYYNVRYPIAYDAGLDVAKAYLQGGFPTIVLIDSDHRIRYIDTGEISQNKLEHWLNSTQSRTL